MAYKHLHDGEWANVPKGVFMMACCDCSLVHVVQIARLRGGGVRYRAWRNVKATTAKRKATGRNAT